MGNAKFRINRPNIIFRKPIIVNYYATQFSECFRKEITYKANWIRIKYVFLVIKDNKNYRTKLEYKKTEKTDRKLDNKAQDRKPEEKKEENKDSLLKTIIKKLEKRSEPFFTQKNIVMGRSKGIKEIREYREVSPHLKGVFLSTYKKMPLDLQLLINIFVNDDITIEERTDMVLVLKSRVRLDLDYDPLEDKQTQRMDFEQYQDFEYKHKYVEVRTGRPGGFFKSRSEITKGLKGYGRIKLIEAGYHVRSTFSKFLVKTLHHINKLRTKRGRRVRTIIADSSLNTVNVAYLGTNDRYFRLNPLILFYSWRPKIGYLKLHQKKQMILLLSIPLQLKNCHREQLASLLLAC